jgi:hypothetical protein
MLAAQQIVRKIEAAKHIQTDADDAYNGYGVMVHQIIVEDGKLDQTFCFHDRLNISMQIDLEHLRQEYASFSDEALLGIDRADLVPDAQRIYDEELASRKRAEAASSPDAAEEHTESSLHQDDPDWLTDAAAVFSAVVYPGRAPAPEAVDARDALVAAGIPCHLELTEIPEEHSSLPPPTSQWRVLVPGQLNLYATNVLDRDIYNDQFEAEWKALLETFSDKELRAMNPQVVFCGLFDRLERAKKAYAEELARRKLRT